MDVSKYEATKWAEITRPLYVYASVLVLVLSGENGKANTEREIENEERRAEKPKHLADMSRAGLIIYVLVLGAPDKT